MLAPKALWPFWLAVPLLTALYQGSMKLLALQIGENGDVWRAIASPYVAVILISEITSFLIWLRILSVLPVGRAVPITAVAYLLVVAMGWGLFHEPLRPVQIAGSLLILGGVFLLASPARPAKDAR